MTASISRSSFAQTRSCACLLDLFIVWHAYFPVTLACLGLAYMLCFLVPLSVCMFVFGSSLSCSGLAGKFYEILTCLFGMFSRHA